MAVNEQLIKRVRTSLHDIPGVEEKKMFSGIAFMVNEKLCISVGNNRMMCRIDPALHNELIQKPGCTTVVMKGRDWIDESAIVTKSN